MIDSRLARPLRGFRWLGFWFGCFACSLQMPSEDEVFAPKTAETSDGGNTADMTGSIGGSSSMGGAPAGGKSAVGANGGRSVDVGGGSSTGGSGRGGSSQGGSTNGGATKGGAHVGGVGGASEGGSSDGGSSGSAGEAGIGTGGGSSEGLVAHFEFEETTGTVAANTVDQSRNASFVGTCSHVPGKRGNAVGIRNLENGTLDYVELPEDIFSGLKATTIAMWVRDLSTARKGGRLFDFSRGAEETLYFAPDQPNPETSTNGGHLGGIHGGVSFVDIWLTKSLTDKAWHHVAVTWSASSIDLYIDGSRAGGKSNPGVIASDLGATSTNWLGRTLDDAFIALYAEMDDLRIYDRVLSRAEISSLYR
ncbi:MAG TPA: LamG domain-containing protein [Polyangiaceae bacterium]|nr:LamG domain-containing protein [Polyangiaceae bacterium]